METFHLVSRKESYVRITVRFVKCE